MVAIFCMNPAMSLARTALSQKH